MALCAQIWGVLKWKTKCLNSITPMTFDPYADLVRLTDPKPRFPPPSSSAPPAVKSEPSSSPSPPHSFSFSYPLPSLDSPDHIRLPYHSVTHDRSVFRFGMPHAHSPHLPDSWSLKRPQHDPPHNTGIPLDLNALGSFHDDYEDADDLSDLPGTTTSGPASHAGQSERIVRRRSSKGTFRLLVSVDVRSDLSRPSMRSVQKKQVQVRACPR